MPHEKYRVSDTGRHDLRVTPENIEELIEGYDFVVDGADNFQTRYLVNDACTLAGIPFSPGSIFRFEGQVPTFTDAANMEFDKVEITKKDDCPVCGDDPIDSIHEVEYTASCSISREDEPEVSAD